MKVLLCNSFKGDTMTLSDFGSIASIISLIVGIVLGSGLTMILVGKNTINIVDTKDK